MAHDPSGKEGYTYHDAVQILPIEDMCMAVAFGYLRTGLPCLEGVSLGIAGSFALFLYEWDQLDKKPQFNPVDCDVYIICSDKSDYVAVYEAFLIYLTSRSINHSSVYKVVECPNGSTLFIYDVMVKYIPFKISLIWVEEKNPLKYGFNPVQGYIEQNFDIDIVMVSVNPFTGTFCTNEAVKEAIESRTATVQRTFIFENFVPKESELKLLNSTFNRMIKYSNRGYSFSNFPTIVCKKNDTINKNKE